MIVKKVCYLEGSLSWPAHNVVARIDCEALPILPQQPGPKVDTRIVEVKLSSPVVAILPPPLDLKGGGYDCLVTYS